MEIAEKRKIQLRVDKPHWSFRFGPAKVTLGTFDDVGKGFKITWRF